MTERTDAWLWDRSGPVDPEIQALEELLRPLGLSDQHDLDMCGEISRPSHIANHEIFQGDRHENQKGSPEKGAENGAKVGPSSNKFRHSVPESSSTSSPASQYSDGSRTS